MIVVADTSVLINLCCVGQGGLFRRLFREVVIRAVNPVLDALRRDAGFWISQPLRDRVLRLAGEAA